MVVRTLLQLNIEAGNASNTGTSPASSSARILEQLKSVSQSSSAIHGINMILATWVYVPVGWSTLEQQFQTSQGQYCSPSKLQELPCKVYDTGPASET